MGREEPSINTIRRGKEKRKRREGGREGGRKGQELEGPERK